MRWKRWVAFTLGMVALAELGGAGSLAQTGKQTRQEDDFGDIAVSLFGALNGTVTNNNTLQQVPGDSLGAMLEVRINHSSLVGFEGTYSYTRPSDTALICTIGTPAGPPGSPQPPCPILSPFSTTAQQITGDWIVSRRLGHFRPFALAGLGGVFTGNPQNSVYTQGSANMAYVYGVGTDWRVLPRIGLRFQYRGNLYKLPNISREFASSSAFMHSAEPMIGVHYRF